MDELEVSGKKYISSKRASEITGYAKDYIGQLARAGKIEGTRVGRAWYVNEAQLKTYLGGSAGEGEKEKKEEVYIPLAQPRAPKKPLLHPHMITPAVFPKTWSTVRYIDDTTELLPSLSKTIHHTPSQPTPSPEVPVAQPISAVQIHKEPTKKTAAAVDGIKPRVPILRVAEPKEVSIPQKSPEISPRREKHVSVSWSYGSFAASIVVFILVFGSLTSFTVFKNNGGSPEAVTASTYYGFTDFINMFKDARLLDAGVEALRRYYTILEESFGAFLSAGLDFVLKLL
jgi:excisionase family DNA binding protein